MKEAEEVAAVSLPTESVWVTSSDELMSWEHCPSLLQPTLAEWMVDLLALIPGLTAKGTDWLSLWHK